MGNSVGGGYFPRCQVNNLEGLLWAHTALLSLSGIIIISSFISQWRDAAPYGRHATAAKAGQWGPPIPQRWGHFISDALPGIPFFLTVFLLYAGLLPTGGVAPFKELNGINIVLALCLLLHYVWRGFITPLLTPYSSPTVALGITLAGIFPNCLFFYLIAAQLACTEYPVSWAYDPRFIIGVMLFIAGYVTNRWADLTLRAGRLALRRGTQCAKGAGGGGGGTSAPLVADGDSSLGHSNGGGGSGGRPGEEEAAPTEAAKEAGAKHYFIPRGGLFELVSCPNYLGELVEWGGYALACWSWPSLAWALFGLSTFLPRALTHHRWYRTTFGAAYPKGRKALIPYVL